MKTLIRSVTVAFMALGLFTLVTSARPPPLGAVTTVSPSRPYAPQCTNITTDLHNIYPNGSPLGGNPRVGMAHNEYYYLDFMACSTSAHFVVDTQWCWNIQIFVGPNHNFARLTKFATDKSSPLIDYTFATKKGQEYAIRVQNIMGPKADISQVHS